MAHGVRGKRGKAVSDWVVQPMEGRVLLSQAGAAAPAPAPAEVAMPPASQRTAISLQASSVVGPRRATVTLTASVIRAAIRLPLDGGMVRFSEVSPTPLFLGTSHTNVRGQAKLSTRRLAAGQTYLIEARFVSPSGAYTPSSTQLDVTVARPPAASLKITAPRYYGAPGTPITFTVTALDPAGRPVTDYTGTVQYFSPTERTKGFKPASYTFTTADQGSHTFVDGWTFHKGGAETLEVQQVNNTRIQGIQAFGIE